MGGTLHARRARGSVRCMSTALSTLAEYARANPRSQAAHERALRLFPSGLTHDARRAGSVPGLASCAPRAPTSGTSTATALLDYVTGHGALRGRALRTRRWSRRCAARPASASISARAASCSPTGPSASWHWCRAPSASASPRAAPRRRCWRCASRAASPAAAACSSSPVISTAGTTTSIPGVGPPGRARPPRGSPPNPDLAVVDPFAEGALERELARGDVACVILEPTGATGARCRFRPSASRRSRRRHAPTASLVIFDEVVTGFRWSPGGAQAVIGVTPDLTALAKVVAGGLPGGALTGREDVMEVLAFGEGRPRSSTPARTTPTRSRPRPASRRSTCSPTAPPWQGRTHGRASCGQRSAEPSSSARRPATPTARRRRSASSSASARTTRRRSSAACRSRS